MKKFTAFFTATILSIFALSSCGQQNQINKTQSDNANPANKSKHGSPTYSQNTKPNTTTKAS
ncbi:MAG: hypothetical protein PHS92_03810 [Candidatus Gracilibacteria bacterium]|nr:hypothetical protein [Candidatus Gracilibacteria bacterium]